jgi:hypothetical protein
MNEIIEQHEPFHVLIKSKCCNARYEIVLLTGTRDYYLFCSICGKPDTQIKIDSHSPPEPRSEFQEITTEIQGKVKNSVLEGKLKTIEAMGYDDGMYAEEIDGEQIRIADKLLDMGLIDEIEPLIYSSDYEEFVFKRKVRITVEVLDE